MIAQRIPLRLPRAGAVALVVLLLAAGAHLAAGGQLPALPIMAALAAVVGLSAVLVAGAKLTAPRLSFYLCGSQLALHLGFSTLSTPAAGRPGPAHHGPSLLNLEGAASHQHLVADPGTYMTFVHLAATLGTAVLIARGEAALWALAAWLRPLCGALVPAVLPADFRHPPRPGRSVDRGCRTPVQVVVRGPPLRFCRS
ncbi:hypothetical protein [Pseudarthrobacter sp. NIBRBAC000502771]|uniref:hypothetical protein n=1 Tax=Pseudarthrobacter sp. NIBRBAC000502771 TaxID=2590774 RepID=UPI001131D8AA|nr:hypothetical protein [Pseudarthrobacter sp. NIBRBAC000502771]QDG61688.1 hypothetical protein NIBR502771_04760 [Pseudarthrobacter sp. NIBRBAC000502771]